MDPLRTLDDEKIISGHVILQLRVRFVDGVAICSGTTGAELRRAQRDPPADCATLSVEFATASCARRSSLVVLIAEASAMTIYNLELLDPIPLQESWSLGGQPISLRARK